MQELPSISIIIPVYNTFNFLHECVDSVLKQNYEFFEIILIDDGSYDGSDKICDQYARTDKRIKVIHRKNGGVSSARNLGINIAKYDWLMFLDSDDFLEDGTLQKCSQHIQSNYDWFLFGFFDKPKFNCREETFHIIQYNLCVQRVDFIGRCRFNNIEYSPKNMRCNLRLTSQCAKIYKKRILDDFNIRFPENIKDNEDGFFNMSYIIHIKSALFVNEPIYHVRTRYDSASRSLKDRTDRIVLSLHEYNSFLIKNNIDESIERYQCIDLFLKSLLIYITLAKLANLGEISKREAFVQLKKVFSDKLINEKFVDMKVSYIKGLVNKFICLLMKMKLFKATFFIIRIHYKRNNRLSIGEKK